VSPRLEGVRGQVWKQGRILETQSADSGKRSYAEATPMALSADQILQELRALPAAERLRVVEQVVHEVAREVTPSPPTAGTTAAIWANESDADFEAFQAVVQNLRAVDIWRAGDGQGPR
jgi:hypothetical protein